MLSQKIKRMAAVALLMALVVVMQFISGMIPPVSGFSISLVLIPVVLGSALYGPGVGALLGGTFGLIVFINCVTGADVGGAMVLQANPVLCFLVVMGKGILAGLASGWVYKLLKNKNTYLAMLCAAIVCPVVNTGIFALGCLVFFWDTLTQWAGGGSTWHYLVFVLIGANFLIEMLLNVVLAPVVVRLVGIAKKMK